MGTSRADLSSFITAMITRNPTMGIPALEDELFVNLLTFDSLYIEIGGAGYRGVDRESKNQLWRWPYGQVCKISSIRIYIFAKNMGPQKW